MKKFINFAGLFATLIMAPAIFAEGKKASLEKATFAAGCFWGTEEFFRKIPGVVQTRVGYTGGTAPNPKYEEMHDGHTGHAESVEIQFDPSKVTYDHLLDQFFKMHDPTTKNQQGNDVGNQYRSAIFYHNEKQKKEAEAFMEKVKRSNAWNKPLVTEISQAKTFWQAEEYHQKYLNKNPGGYDNHYLRKISFDVPANK
jgi:methionine-S-sulfoxide reductase